MAAPSIADTSTATANDRVTDPALLAALTDQLRSTIWGIPQTPQPTAAAPAAAAAAPPAAAPAPAAPSIRLVAGARSAPVLAAAAGLLPQPSQLLPGDLHPLSLSASAFTLLLQSQLLSKAATRAEVRALVLSAPYLPSQLEAFHATAAKLRHSLAVLLGASELHVVVSQLPWQGDDEDDDDGSSSSSSDCEQQQQQRMPPWQRVLLYGLGPARLLEPGQLAAAEDAEDALLAQRRLFSAAVWNAAAQQLQAKHCLLPWLAGLAVVNGQQLGSLRGLAAAQGLHLAVEDMLEQQQQQQELEPPANADRVGSRRRPKRRRKRTTTTNEPAAPAAAPAELPAAAAQPLPLPAAAAPVQEVLLVLSKQPLEAADLAVARRQALASSAAAAADDAETAQPHYQPRMALVLSGPGSVSSSAAASAGQAVEAGEVLGARMHVLLGEPLQGVWAAALAALARSRSMLGQADSSMAAAAALHGGSSSSSRWPHAVPQLLALSGPGLTVQGAEQLMAQQAEDAADASAAAPATAAVQQLGKKRRRGVTVWAWLYDAAAAAEQQSEQADGPVTAEDQVASSSSSSSSSSVEAPPPPSSRRRRRKPTRLNYSSSSSPSLLQLEQQMASAVDAVTPAGSYRRPADAVLLLSWRQLALPQQHPQWGQLLQHQQLAAAWQGPACNASYVQHAHGTSAAAGAAGAAGADGASAAGEARQQPVVGVAVASAAPTPDGTALVATAAQQYNNLAAVAALPTGNAGSQLPGSTLPHRSSSSSSSSQAGGAQLRSTQRRLFHAGQCR
uniref:Uncharacterized protein n=1 Tax=Tetradesmus obliquus TaxID=3088 RepID=A0A383VP96_TETOB|eukprot:jgi/Sobl393_1/12085/SZX66572.1